MDLQFYKNQKLEEIIRSMVDYMEMNKKENFDCDYTEVLVSVSTNIAVFWAVTCSLVQYIGRGISQTTGNQIQQDRFLYSPTYGCLRMKC
jgi:hypothetical protein